MVALAQVLTAAVLIPFAFGAPAADVKKTIVPMRDLWPLIGYLPSPRQAAFSAFGVCAGSSTTTTVSPSPTGSLPISPDATCGNQAGFRCGPGDCCSHTITVGLPQITVVLVVSQHLVCAADLLLPLLYPHLLLQHRLNFQHPTPIWLHQSLPPAPVPVSFALTLDDGPTKNVPGILDMLKKNNIKATFFVNGKKRPI
ncbi:hypothetical protein BASA62_009934 [Batrachochytrium salamandrivorans]|nr:hypothetical protein BASA62_009934 [Batrachochytrium salamandrivorans]